MPFTSAVDVGNGLPPLEAAYHLMAVPLGARLATVGLSPEQKDCAALPVGAPGVALMVTVTSSRALLSQPETVWEAK